MTQDFKVAYTFMSATIWDQTSRAMSFIIQCGHWTVTTQTDRQTDKQWNYLA